MIRAEGRRMKDEVRRNNCVPARSSFILHLSSFERAAA
jgi:hypothetical protein